MERASAHPRRVTSLGPVAPGEVQVARALLSVSDKTGLVPFARGRQTSGMLREMQVPELVAADAGDYVARAVALIRNADARHELAGRIASRNGALFDRRDVVDAFAALLQQVLQPV